MAVSKDQLLNLRDQVLAKRQHYIEMVQQADGAAGVINLLLSQFDKETTEAKNAPAEDRED